MEALAASDDDRGTDVVDDEGAEVFDNEPDWGSFDGDGGAPWEQLDGEPPNPDLPSHCCTCRRPLSVHGLTDPFVRRWLLAGCDLHGDQGRVRW
jgi:hypothetical protein